MVCLSCYIIVDTYFISQALGADGLAALNISAAVFGILFGFGLMIGIGGAIDYSILKGKGEGGEADSTFTHSMLTGLLISIVFSIIGVFFTAPLATLFGADETILPMAHAYMTAILGFAPLFILNSILVAFIRNDNNPRLAMAGMVTGSLSNIALSYLFLFPLNMGMFGAAFASVCSMFLGICVLSLHFIMKRNGFRIRKGKIRIKKAANILFLGSSAFINDLSLSIALITFNLVILGIEGNIGVSAYGIVANIAFIVIAVFGGVAQGVQPLLSKGHGFGDSALIKQVLKYAIMVVLALSVAVYAFVYVFSPQIISIFNSEGNDTLALLADRGLRTYFVGFLFAGLNIIASAFFSAVANAKTGLLISVLRGCVIIIPMAITLSALYGMTGIWLSFVLSELVVCALSAKLLFSAM